jgi:hypothetical protein
MRINHGYTFPERVSSASWETDLPEPIIVKIGFKVTPDARPVWSNPVTISFKRYEDLSSENKLEFEEIHLDGYCYPIIFHIKDRLPIFEQPIIQNQLVINDEQAYQQFLKIRRGVAGRVCDEDKAYKTCMAEQACMQRNLPPVDFSKSTVLGQYTAGSCGTTGFKREVFKNDKSKTITYFVTAINTIAACSGPGGQSLNLIAVPKVPAGYKVIFSYKFI